MPWAAEGGADWGMRDACGLTRDFSTHTHTHTPAAITTFYSPDILSALVPFLVFSLSRLRVLGGGEVQGESVFDGENGTAHEQMVFREVSEWSSGT